MTRGHHASGWGGLTLEKSRPEVNRRWTDTDSAHGERGSTPGQPRKPAACHSRPNWSPSSGPISPPSASHRDGRMFASDPGHPVASTAVSDVWAEARTLALTPAQFASPLAGRPYDLRHAAVSLWLAAGVPAPGGGASGAQRGSPAPRLRQVPR